MQIHFEKVRGRRVVVGAAQREHDVEHVFAPVGAALRALLA